MSERISNHESESSQGQKTGWESLIGYKPPTREQWEKSEEDHHKKLMAEREQKLQDEQKAYNEAQWRDKVEKSFLVKNIEKRESEERDAEKRAKEHEESVDKAAAERKRFDDAYIPKDMIEAAKQAELRDLDNDLRRYARVEEKIKAAGGSRDKLSKEERATYRESIAQASYKKRRYQEVLKTPPSQIEYRLKHKKIAYEDAQARYKSMGVGDKLKATMGGKKLGKWEDVAIDYKTSTSDLERMFKTE